MNKAFWTHLKHFGRLLGKIYQFLNPSKTDGRVPSQHGAPTTCNFITGQLGCGHRAKFLQWKGGGRGGGEEGKGVSDEQHIAAIFDVKAPHTLWIVYFQATLSFQGHTIFSKSPSQQNFAQITNILRNKSFGCPCRLHSGYIFHKRRGITCIREKNKSGHFVVLGSFTLWSVSRIDLKIPRVFEIRLYFMKRKFS